MPRLAVSINRDFYTARSAPKGGRSGRRVRRLGAIVEPNEPDRWALRLFARLLMAAIWLACIACAALAVLIWRFY
jgi:hypothetical protein